MNLKMEDTKIPFCILLDYYLEIMGSSSRGLPLFVLKQVYWVLVHRNLSGLHDVVNINK